MRRRLVLVLGALGAAGTLVAAGVGGAAPSAKSLSGTVGPGYRITVSRGQVTAGIYTITIRDRARDHNFVLVGPGVNKRTSVGARGTIVWTGVQLKKGTYRFYCSPHPVEMRGTIRVT